MAESPMRVEDVVVPPPALWRIAGVELRLEPLPMGRLLEATRFIEKNKDLPDILKAAFSGDKGLSGALEGDVIPRLNALVRLLFWKQAEVLTDEWCLAHLSLAHYVAFCQQALIQNRLHDVFQAAKGLAGQFIMAFLRSRLPQAPTP